MSDPGRRILRRCLELKLPTLEDCGHGEDLSGKVWSYLFLLLRHVFARQGMKHLLP